MTYIFLLYVVCVYCNNTPYCNKDCKYHSKCKRCGGVYNIKENGFHQEFDLIFYPHNVKL